MKKGDSVTHIAGAAVVIEGRYHRQRCAWCGTVLIDDDLDAMASPGGPTRPRSFEATRLVRVIQGNPRSMSVLDVDGLPDDACVYAEKAR